MGTVAVTLPNAEPIDLALAKLQIGFTSADRDSLVKLGLSGARNDFESGSGRQLMHARYQYVINEFPGQRFYLDDPNWRHHYTNRVGRRQPESLPHDAIVPRHTPIVRVVSISYLDSTGATVTLDPSDYVVNLAPEPAYIAPAHGTCWPTALCVPGAVTVTYDAGYASRIVFAGSASANATVIGPVTWAVDDPVRFSNSGGALPAELAEMTDFYVKTALDGVYTFAATIGGSAITFATAGTGTSYIGVVPEPAINWMLARIEATFQIRGAALMLDRGQTVAMHPFIDSLLDGLHVTYP